MKRDTLRKAKELEQQISEVEKEVKQLGKYADKADEMLHGWTTSKDDPDYFKQVVCTLGFSTYGDSHEFPLKGKDPDAETFYRKLFTDVNKIFTARQAKAQKHLTDLQRKLDSL
jgi:hypothetical protein